MCYHKSPLDAPHAQSMLYHVSLQSICSARDPVGGRLPGDSAIQDPAPDSGRATLRKNEAESQSTRERKVCGKRDHRCSFLPSPPAGAGVLPSSAVPPASPALPISACPLPFTGLVTPQVPAPTPLFHPPCSRPVTGLLLPSIVTTEPATRLPARRCTPDG